MKRVIVVSDSHGMEDRLREILLQAFSLGPVDVIVFLGDAGGWNFTTATVI